MKKGIVVLAFSNSNYVDNAYVYPMANDCTEEKDRIELYVSVHVGTSRDSVVINNVLIPEKMNEVIDIKYFPEFHPLRFYAWRPGKYRVFVKNNGTEELMLLIPRIGEIVISPGEEKEIQN